MTATCRFHARPPVVGCGCGISYISTAEKIAGIFAGTIQTPTYAITYGEALGTRRVDSVEPDSLSHGYYVASGYRATAILAPADVAIDYEIPCSRGQFTLDNLTALQA